MTRSRARRLWSGRVRPGSFLAGGGVARAHGLLGALPTFAKRKTFWIDLQGVIRHVGEHVDGPTMARGSSAP